MRRFSELRACVGVFAIVIGIGAVIQAQSLPRKPLWPQAPERTRGAAENGQPGPRSLLPSQALQPDPLQVLDGAAQWKGLFAYTPVVYHDPANPEDKSRHFILRGNNMAGGIGPVKSSVADYIAGEGDGNTFDPRFTPDRQFLTFKNGDWDWGHPSFSLYYWDLYRRKIVQIGDRRLHFPLVEWTAKSERVAYVHGGDSIGTEDDGPTSLAVYDVALTQEKRLAQHPVLNGGARLEFRGLPYFSWLDAQTLLYAQRQAQKGHTLPGIYRVDTRTAQSREVVKNGFAPLASPDQQWIAYLGWPEPAVGALNLKGKTGPGAAGVDHSLERARSVRLCLFNTKTKKITPIDVIRLDSNRRRSMADFTFRFTPDSASLVVVSSYIQYEAGKTSSIGQGEAWAHQIQVIDVASSDKTKNPARTVQTLVQHALPETSLPALKVLYVSNDSHFLFLRKSDPIRMRQIAKEILLAVDLKEGKITEMASFTPSDNLTRGWDWYEEP